MLSAAGVGVKKCCIPECNVNSLFKIPLHRFPHPDRRPEYFLEWVNAIGGDIVPLNPQYIYKNRRVCHQHFESKFYTWNNRLTYNAVPTLFCTGIKIDSLVEVPKEKWTEVQEHAKKSWPRSVPLYYLVKTQLEHPAMADILGLQLLYPYGDICNGVVILNNKGSLYEVIIFPNTMNRDKLIDALVETQRIDWDKRVCVPFAEVDALRCLKKAGKRIGLKITRQVPTIKHFIAKDSELYDVECPTDTYFGPLKHEHIDQVDIAWPHRYATSKDFIRMLIDNDLTYGLFSTKDNSLIAWQLICEVGFLTHLYCEEQHRRRGYAEAILKYTLNDQLKKGNDVFGYVLDENLNSMKLFRKLDFEVIGRGIWTFVTRDK